MVHLRSKVRVLRWTVLFAVFMLVDCGMDAAPAGSSPGLKTDFSAAWSAIDAAVAEGLREKKMPGCVVAIGCRGELVLLKAFGRRQVEPEPAPMTVDTVFDLASLTKPIATATSVMVLAERKLIDPEQPVVRYVPEFGPHGKDQITIAQLLTHQSGLIADNDIADYADGPEKAFQRICDLKLTAAPGTKFQYSDVGFIVLGKLVERVAKKPLDEFARDAIFRPLGMRETGYRPNESLRSRAAPTEKRDGEWMRGVVHDPRAFALGGVAGHAGLFSTAADVAVFAQAILDQGRRDRCRILLPETVTLMTSPRPLTNGGLRSFGWDMQTGYSKNRGTAFSPRAFGHSGFTGTSLWIDPDLECFVVFLSNRVHPSGQGSVNPLAGQIGTIVGQAIVRPALGQSVAEHAESDGGLSLSGRRLVGDDQSFGRPRDRLAVRGDRRAVDRCRFLRKEAWSDRIAGRAIPARRVHANLEQVRRPAVSRRADDRDRSEGDGAGSCRAGHSVGASSQLPVAMGFEFFQHPARQQGDVGFRPCTPRA
jgi:CubicO group peptidase (beta-lactamase class C family)